MYEHLRANLALDITTAQQGVTRAIAHRDQIAATVAQQQAALPGLQAAVSAAEATLTARNADLATAQAVVNQRTAERDSAEAERDAAQEAFDQNGGDEPPPTDDLEELRQWRRIHDQLKAALRDAQAALDAANALLQQVLPPRDAAAAAAQGAAASLAQARDRVTAQNATIAATQQQLAAAEADIATARADVDAVHARVAVLDQREAVLTAQSLDRTALEHVADSEEADLHAGWQHRHDLFERRVQFRTGRAGILAAHDTTVDEVAVLRSRIVGSPEAAAFGGLAGVVSGIDAVLAANATQRPRPALERTDDLAEVSRRLTSLTFELQAVTGVATAARDQAAQQLEQAGADLIAHQQERP